MEPGEIVHSSDTPPVIVRKATPEQSESLGELFAALAKAQGQIVGAKKDGSNPFFKSQYSTLEACMAAIKKPFSDNGLCILQPLMPSGQGTVRIKTILGHQSGEWISSTRDWNPAKTDPQSEGSATSYGRRYGLKALVGLADDEGEDDGEAAVGRGKKSASKTQVSDALKDMPFISKAQANRLYAIAKDSGFDNRGLQDWLSKKGYQKSAEIKKADYDGLIKEIQSVKVNNGGEDVPF